MRKPARLQQVKLQQVKHKWLAHAIEGAASSCRAPCGEAEKGRRRAHSIVKRAGGELRIVGGAWRGRRLRFAAAPGLRPTPDRLRETLFNWLGDWIVGRWVLDLYAGSGALGIEALSRGAAAAVFVERSASAAAALRANLERLGAESARVECTDALEFLHSAPGRFDLVLVDPPWASELAGESLALLTARQLLAADHRVYLEQPAASIAGVFDRAGDWEVVKTARAGEACGRLLRLRGDL